MNGQETQGRDYRFLIGLAMGGLAGASLAMWLAPRAAAEIKARAVNAAKDVGEAVDGLSRKGQGLRDDGCDTVIRAAQQVEAGARNVQHYATDAKTKVS
jgi:gas vesicle protein